MTTLKKREVTGLSIIEDAANAILGMRGVKLGHSKIGDNYALGIVEAILKAIHLDPTLLAELQNGTLVTHSVKRQVQETLQVSIATEPQELRAWKSPGERPFVLIATPDGISIGVSLEVAYQLEHALKAFMHHNNLESPSNATH